jgi:LmbE family N-acetylglucosaminyl deacetylase
MENEDIKNVVLIVAHPDDETLWAGGTILANPSWKCFVVCLCRKNDAERAPRFYAALKQLNAEGIMGDLDDGPEQDPLHEKEVEELIVQLLPPTPFDVIITHNPDGEYTRHLRHEEISRAVADLWRSGKLQATEFWTFAYEDGHKKYFPLAIPNASVYTNLSQTIWQQKYKLITETYGFEAEGWEAQTTPKAEAFWKLTDPSEIKKYRFENEPV